MEFLLILRLVLFALFIATFFYNLKNHGLNKTFQFLVVTLLISFPLEYFSSTTGFITGSRFVHNLGGPSAGRIPILILTSWWAIVSGVMTLTNRIFAKKQPVYKLVLLDTLLAVALDLVLDPLATVLKIWEWEEPGIFFGVPVGNFLLWVIAVGLTSFVTRKFIFKAKS